jgi:hypothetical protein
MAKEEHYDMLKQGVESWHEWREKNPYVIPDLVEANLIDVSLSGIDLGRADLSGANLSWTDLSRANLSRAILIDANLSGAILVEADLIRANLSGTDLSGGKLFAAHLVVILNGIVVNLNTQSAIKQNLPHLITWQDDLMLTIMASRIYVQLFQWNCPP